MDQTPEERIDAIHQTWNAYFNSPLSKFRAAMQTDNYVLERKDFLDSCDRMILDNARYMDTIIKDYQGWRKHNEVKIL
jgi:hypothetical protein